VKPTSALGIIYGNRAKEKPEAKPRVLDFRNGDVSVALDAYFGTVLHIRSPC